MNYIFIGGTLRGYELVSTLISNGYLPDYSVVLKEDEHENFKTSGLIIDLLKEKNLPYSLRKKLNEQDIEVIKEKKRDFAIVCGWRTLIDPSLDQFFNFGFLAAHDSLLPKYRGFAPINWAIICGEKETGVTLFRIMEGEADSGPVFGQKKVSIENEDYAEDVYKKIITATIELYQEFIEDFKLNKVKFKKQDDTEASYTCKRTPADGKIHWQQSSTEVLNLIRALAPPYPGAWCFFQDEKYIVHRAVKGLNDSKKFVKNIPGRVLQVASGGVEVMCGSGTISITAWSKDGMITKPEDIVKSITTTLI